MPCIGPRFVKFEKCRLKDGTIGDKIVHFYSKDEVAKLDVKKNWAVLDKIPCRKCYPCRIQKSLDWGCRIYLECKKSDYNYFITFTYSNDFLPRTLGGLPNLRYKDVITFINSLRKQKERSDGVKFKYFFASEYGSKYGRPHYHMILFGCKIDDLILIDSDKKYYSSKSISNLWGKGMVVVANVSFESGAYVAQYTVKKQVDRKNYWRPELDREKEKLYCSKYLGYDYFVKNYDFIKEFDTILVKTKTGVKHVPVPYYFQTKFKQLDRSLYDSRVVSRRKKTVDLISKELFYLDCDFFSLMQYKKEDFFAKNKDKLSFRGKKFRV